MLKNLALHYPFLFINCFNINIYVWYPSQMFKGNSDGNSIHYNVFEVPIIAQWVRINPTRWHDRISMRVELYGCDYSKC